MDSAPEGDNKEIQQPMDMVEVPSDAQQQPSRDGPVDSTETGASSQSQPPPKVIKPNKVYIGGLPDDTREADLQDCFGTFGAIKSIELKTGYGFVEFNSQAAAEKAVSVYNEGVFLGNTIRVELSHGGGKTNAKQMAEPGACFKCGQHGHWARECPNHSVTLHHKKWIDRTGGSGNYHQRSDSYRDNHSSAPTPVRPRDDYRVARPKGDDYAPRPRDYGARDGDYRRPPSPTYDYGRGDPLPPPAPYSDRRAQPAPRPSYGVERPPSPYGAPRPTGPSYASREYDRGYDRAAPYYDARAPPPPPPPVTAPYADRRGDPYGAAPAYPPTQPYAYPPPHEPAGRRSPPPARQAGRYQNYNNQNGYSRPYERRRSASPPLAAQRYRDDIPQAPANGYTRNSAPYGRPQPYSSGYGDAPSNGRGPMVSPVSGPAGDRMGARDYRGGYRG